MEEGKELGIVTDIISRPYQDIYEVTKPDGKVFSIPAVKEFIKDVDTEAQIITVKLPEGLTEL